MNIDCMVTGVKRLNQHSASYISSITRTVLCWCNFLVKLSLFVSMSYKLCASWMTTILYLVWSKLVSRVEWERRNIPYHGNIYNSHLLQSEQTSQDACNNINYMYPEPLDLNRQKKVRTCGYTECPDSGKSHEQCSPRCLHQWLFLDWPQSGRIVNCKQFSGLLSMLTNARDLDYLQQKLLWTLHIKERVIPFLSIIQ